MTENPPYLSNPGTLTKALEKMKVAATPERFTTDFVSTVLGFKGGNGAALIPYFKRVGFVRSDGSPTELYNQFRNASSTKYAAAEAAKIGYKALYARNEFVHKATDDDLKGIVVEATGLEANSPVVAMIVRTFKNFRAFCDFDGKPKSDKAAKQTQQSDEQADDSRGDPKERSSALGLNLAYSINLHLPATDDIKVFDAIFKSLKENLLKE